MNAYEVTVTDLFKVIGFQQDNNDAYIIGFSGMLLMAAFQSYR
jgi:hypothetical protein